MELSLSKSSVAHTPFYVTGRTPLRAELDRSGVKACDRAEPVAHRAERAGGRRSLMRSVAIVGAIAIV